MALKKHTAKVLQTFPGGRPGDVIEVTSKTPHVDRWLDIGVLEYVKEDFDVSGEADPEQADDGAGQAGGGTDGDPASG